MTLATTPGGKREIMVEGEKEEVPSSDAIGTLRPRPTSRVAVDVQLEAVNSSVA